jgi:hypothetical protein
MQMGPRNLENKYTMKGVELAVTKQEMDIGVAITANLKLSAQCAKAAGIAQTVQGQICHAFRFRHRNIFIKLYKQYERPHFEFSTRAWTPWAIADVECLEKVQKRAGRLVSGLKSNVYEETLRELELLTLTERRHQADMQMIYKIMHDTDHQERCGSLQHQG